ncbi:MAG: hypothetical protein IKH27_13710 [Oscillospiraceae bacterium]|nr:hypothetical protein [Oscillospiraceae bacterium]
MREIRIAVRNKCLKAEGKPEIVCGNSDYLLYFEPDEEWAPYQAKTARFFWYDNRERAFLHTDILFEHNAVQVPVLRNTNEVAVGIFAGDLLASAPLRIPCLPAVTDGSDIIAPLPPDLYTQLVEYLRDLAEGAVIRQTAVLCSDRVTVRTERCRTEQETEGA